MPAARRRRRTSADGGDADFGDTGDADIESTPAVGRQPQRRRRRLSTQARGGDSPAPSLGGGTVTTPVKPTKKAVYSPSVSPAVVADAAPAEASSKREVLLRESAREVEAALAKHSGIPVTRTQVRLKIQENLTEFRGLIAASRQGQRRKFSTRLVARADLPERPARIHPKAEPCYKPEAQWAKILWRRSGWIAIRLEDISQRLLFLYTEHGRTQWLDFSSYATTRVLGKPLHHKAPVDFVVKLLPFRQLSDVIGAKAVSMYQVSLEASSDDSFVSFWISGSGTPLTKPLPRPPKKEAEEADDERESDEGLVRLIGSGADDSVLSADSHVESVVSSNSSAGAKKKPATAGAKPAPSGVPASSGSDSSSSRLPSSSSDSGSSSDSRSSPSLDAKKAVTKTFVTPKAKTTKKTPLQDWTYYYIRDNRGTKHRDIKLIIRDTYCTADALGEKDKSKAVTPSHYGETFEDPVRSILLVRAWALYRCQSLPWVSKVPWRAREFAIEAGRLMRDVAALGAEDHLLGNRNASKIFSGCLPEVAASLRELATAQP